MDRSISKLCSEFFPRWNQNLVSIFVRRRRKEKGKGKGEGEEKVGRRRKGTKMGEEKFEKEF